MKLSSYLDSKLIFVDVDAKNKDELIEVMIKKASRADDYFAKREDEIKEAVLKREHEISTAMGKGIAIPHARIQGFEDVIVLIGVMKEPIICELAVRGEDSVKMFFMIVAGQTKNKIMLKIMSAIMKLASNDEALSAIYRDRTPHGILDVIKKEEIEASNRITAEDVMNTDIEPASLDDNLDKIAKRFVVERLRGIPVIDRFGKFIGEITERELIQYGMPKYTSLMNDLSFMTIGEPFEEYFKNETKVTVEELYRKNPIFVDRKASIMEVSFLMVTKGNTRIYVVEGGKYYGMIIRSDIIRKVLHI